MPLANDSPSGVAFSAHANARDVSLIGRISPDEWAALLPRAADLSSSLKVWPAAQVRQWRGMCAMLEQPPLDHHCIVQYLDSTKLVSAQLDAPPAYQVVESGSLTIVPAGLSCKWITQGPIEFAHLYISPMIFAHAASRLAMGSTAALIERIGCRDPLLEALYTAMLVDNRLPLLAEPLYLDSLLETFLLHLLRKHSTAIGGNVPGREVLPKHRLLQVKDFIEERLEFGITLGDLARIAGGSVYHFSRAFKNSVGDSPYNYVLRRRTERAKVYLMTSNRALDEIACACGFRNTVHLSKTFSRLVGIAPSRFRRKVATPRRSHGPERREMTEGPGI